MTWTTILDKTYEGRSVRIEQYDDSYKVTTTVVTEGNGILPLMINRPSQFHQRGKVLL